ncbi:DUF1007 family protein [Salinarimonas rosea]|uniref:DUF1007 family protein n=1 Tax=Salinarimonas rosea TaxID=552063 RepID=UPI0003FCFD1E|nr:DUF1007 family protein [Salinarimonas rosea]
MTLRPRQVRVPAALAGLAAAWALAPSPAAAHPHIWVETKTEIVWDDAGRVAALAHAWRFDEANSASMVLGLDVNGDGRYTTDELAEMAELNATSLGDFGYFTFLKADGTDHAFAAPRDYRLAHDGTNLTLHFTLPLESPAEPDTALVLEVYDPEFFISFRMADGDDAVVLAGAPGGCAIDVARATEVRLDQFVNLSEAFFDAITATESLGVEIVNRALVACP